MLLQEQMPPERKSNCSNTFLLLNIAPFQTWSCLLNRVSFVVIKRRSSLVVAAAPLRRINPDVPTHAAR
jgi:hypothetical protein